MTPDYSNGTASQDERPSALDVGLRPDAEKMTRDEYEEVVKAGHDLAQQAGGRWLLVSGKFISDNNKKGTEGHLRDMLRGAFGYPPPKDGPHDIELNILLDSPGGSLDSAYASTLYIKNYSKNVKVFVPVRAKSASTLLALGADVLYLSPFGELGPLDTQIPDPRNPANHMSALDCYQSVDYVRDFGIKTVERFLPVLVEETGRKIPVDELLDVASEYSQGIVRPMLQNISGLDFGGWGRSLRIGENYARRLLRMHAEDFEEKHVKDIAARLVFGYTHHLFPIDYTEACHLGLPVEVMEQKVYEKAATVVEKCNGKDFVGWVSKDEAEEIQPWAPGIKDSESEETENDSHDGSEHAQATRIT